MKRFINDRDRIVQESIDGLIWSSSDLITRLDGFPDIKVVVRRDWSREVSDEKVALISGGGSGHEPSHAGLVGPGLLTAAVAGEIFASPGVDAVLSAIVAVTGKAGCLLIVKNYTGDRINFGLAAEKARAQFGLDVRLCFVRDDIALLGELSKDRTGSRGIAGTVFCHKIAGALADDGKTLSEICTTVEAVAEATLSIGASLSTCKIPGADDDEGGLRLKGNEMEVGLGIHGEPGAKTVPFVGARETVKALVDELLAHLPALSDGVALLINNLGSVPPMEMSIIAEAVSNSPLAEKIRVVIGPGQFMTSLQMNGFSLSCLALPQGGGWEDMLLRHSTARGWLHACRMPVKPPLVSCAALTASTQVSPSQNPVVEKAMRAVLNRLEAAEADLNELDGKVGDGDCGTTFATAARRIISEMGSLPLDSPEELMISLGHILSKAVGGTSGVLLSLFFTATGAAMKSTQPASWNNVAAFQAGVEVVMRYGGAKPGDRSMLDAMIPAIEHLGHGIDRASSAAESGAKATATMEKASAGRSAYVPGASLRGVEDPGARAVAIIFYELRNALSESQ